MNRDVLECKVRFVGKEMIWKKGEATEVPEGLQKLIEAVCGSYDYLLG